MVRGPIGEPPPETTLTRNSPTTAHRLIGRKTIDRHDPDLIREHLPHAADALSQLDSMSRSIDGLKATVTRMAEATSTITILRYRREVEKLLAEEGVPAEIIEKIRRLDP